MEEERTLDERSERSVLLNELLSLSERGEIKYTPKYLKKASNETPERIQVDYKRKQLDTVNKEVTDVLIRKFSELMETVANIDDVEGLKSELMSNGLLRDELKRIIGYVTPMLPYIGIIGGGVIIAKYIYMSTVTKKKERNQNEEEVND